jgi:hypothetical protein
VFWELDQMQGEDLVVRMQEDEELASERKGMDPLDKRGWELLLLDEYTLPREELLAELRALWRAAGAQQEAWLKAPRRRRLSENERDGAVCQLAEIFHKSTIAAQFVKAMRGDGYPWRLVDFVSAALKAARLPVPVSHEKVWALVPKAWRSPRK